MRARVRTRAGKLYVADVELAPGWAIMTNVRRLSRHGDGYAAVGCADMAIPVREIEWVRWDQDEGARWAA